MCSSRKTLDIVALMTSGVAAVLAVIAIATETWLTTSIPQGDISIGLRSASFMGLTLPYDCENEIAFAQPACFEAVQFNMATLALLILTILASVTFMVLTVLGTFCDQSKSWFRKMLIGLSSFGLVTSVIAWALFAGKSGRSVALVIFVNTGATEFSLGFSFYAAAISSILLLVTTILSVRACKVAKMEMARSTQAHQAETV